MKPMIGRDQLWYSFENDVMYLLNFDGTVEYCDDFNVGFYYSTDWIFSTLTAENQAAAIYRLKRNEIEFISNL